MVAKAAFELVAEFVFDEAVALAATNTLTKSVENLSKKTDDAIFGVARLGMAYAKNFVTGGGGFLGFMGAAVKSSEAFRKTQIELANTMLTNKFSVNGEVLKFNESLEVADHILGKINAKAKRFGISPQALASSTSMFAKVLGPKGLAGDNMEDAMSLARVTVKGVPALDMDQTNAQGQILNALGGQLSKQTIFGSRLFAEAGDVMSESTDGIVKDIKSFNKASKETRLKALIAGLDKMSGSMDIVGLRSKLLSNRLYAIRDAFFGIGSILKPLGDTLTKILGPILDMILKQVQKKGPMIVRIMNDVFKKMGKSPELLYINVKQFASLHGDIQKAGSALRNLSMAIILIGTVAHITAVRTFVLGLGAGTGAMAFMSRGLIKLTRIFQGLLGRTLLTRFALLIPNLAALVFIFQILTRAASKIRITFLKLSDVFGGRFLKQIDKFLTVVGLISEPMSIAVEAISDFLGSSFLMEPAFNLVLWLFESLNNVLQTFAIVIQGVLIALQSVGAGIGAFVGTIYAGLQNPTLFLNTDYLKQIATNPFEAGGNQMDKGIKSVVDRLLNPSDGKSAVASNVIKNTLHNTFNIKEKIEPDRIAFTLTEQLRKMSENSTSYAGGPVITAGGF